MRFRIGRGHLPHPPHPTLPPFGIQEDGTHLGGNGRGSVLTELVYRESEDAAEEERTVESSRGRLEGREIYRLRLGCRTDLVKVSITRLDFVCRDVYEDKEPDPA
jgi:hypothetical protein